MKIRIFSFVIIILLAIAPKSIAQWDISAGPKIGLNLSTFDAKFILQTPSTMKSSFLAGGFLRAQNMDEIYYQVEFLIMGKGANFAARDTIPGMTVKTSYIEIPLILGYQPKGDFLDVQIGVAFSNLLSAFAEVEGSNVMIEDEFNRWDFSVLGAIGFEFNPGVGFNARMTYGITNALTDIQTNQVFTTEMHNFSLAFSVWYKIPIVKNRY